MRKLLIVYYSQSGHTEALAQGVIAGAEHPEVDDVQVRVRSALDAGASDVLWCEALILGSPENFGYMSGAVKLWFDRIYYPCLGQTEGLPWALFIRAGNDGRGALRSIDRIVDGLGWRRVQEPVICAGEFKEAFIEQCRELGQTVAASLEAGLF